MNVVDIAIVGALGLLLLIGMMKGILGPASAIGGFMLGTTLATQQYGTAAQLLADYVEMEWLRNGIAFIAIIALVVVLMKVVVGLIKKFMSALFLGWVDKLGGAAAAAVVGVLVVGTAIHIMGGVNMGSTTQEAMGASTLAPQIAKASLISTPLCSDGSTADCTSLIGLAEDFVGDSVTSKLEETIGGYNIGSLLTVAKSGLTGSTDGLVDVVKASDTPSENQESGGDDSEQ